MKALLLFTFFYTLFLQVRLSIQQDCSATNPCPLGCCSKSGYCGYGPDYCGDGCKGTCERKSECNPGWEGDKWSNSTDCPLKVCCSKYVLSDARNLDSGECNCGGFSKAQMRSGYCGTTKDFCGDKTVKRPSCDIGSTSINKVIGYYEAWSMTERSCYGMQPEDIPFGIYTHINFAFATIDPQSFQIQPGNTNTELLMTRIGSLKLLQPDVQIWVAVGGWSFNDPWMPTATTFSKIASDEKAQDSFIKSLILMMNTYGFDGIDIDWEYPGAEDRSGRKEDYDNFTKFIQKLRDRIGKKGISLTLPASYWYLQHFDIKGLEKHVDWFNVMTYDMHGAWDIDNKWTGPFVNAHTNWTDIQDGLDLLWRNDISADKVILGTSFYTRSFQLSDPSCSEPKCGVASAGNPGKCSRTAGVLLHPEVQDIIKEKGLTPKGYRTETVKTIHWDNQWASFDDESTWRLKLNNARGQCIKGIMVWAISQDDKDSTNAMALTRAAGRKVMDMPDFSALPLTRKPLKAIPLCRWSNCGEQCPSGFKQVPHDGTKNMMEDKTPCSGLTSYFCCPSDSQLPTCTWRGKALSGECSAGCQTGEVEVGTQTAGCYISHQSACCTDTSSTHAWGMCKWYGSASLCAPAGKRYECPKDRPKQVLGASAGFGGEQTCTQGAKSFCCSEIPDAFIDCAWYKKETHNVKADYFCEPSCPAGSIRLARQSGDCSMGNQAYCCKGKPEPDLQPQQPGFGGKGAEEFKLLLQKFMKDPTCPKKTLHPTLHDWHPEPAQRKRGLELAAKSRKAKRDDNCTNDLWTRLIQYAGVLFGHSSSNMTALQNIWDNEFAGYYDYQLGYANLTAYFKSHPTTDRTAVLEYVFYDAISAGPALRLSMEAESKICTSSKNSKRSLLIDVFGQELPRAIQPWGDGTDDASDGIPSWVVILEGINRGDLSLHYARWQYQTGTGSGAAAGPFLELAYWIGPTPGVAPTTEEESDRNLGRYRDHRPRGNIRADRFVVFHLHIDPDTNVFNRANGRTRIGIQHVTMFHGVDVTHGPSGTWRVNSREFDNQRGDGFVCGEDTSIAPNNGLWYVGAPARSGLPIGPFYDFFDRWAGGIFTGGYLGTPGISPILRGANFDANGDIDPTSQPAFLRYGEGSVEFGGQNPYLLSFVIVRDGERVYYNFNIPDPGAPPSP